jgi:uncharacterized membrane protein YbhN (UPF0104 family)
MSSVESPERVSAASDRSRMIARAFMLLRVLVPTVAIAVLLRVIPLQQVLASMRLIRTSALFESAAAIVLSTLLATVRWRIVFKACGLDTKPRYLELLRAYWIGVFYNTYVPGGLGGDVVRGVATRRVVGPGGLPVALAIVLLERTLGFSGMLILVVSGFALFPLPGIPNVMLFSVLGLCVAVAAVVVIASGPRIARFLPAPAARIASSLPTIASLPLFLVALGLSVLTQLCGVVVGHVLISSINTHVAWSDSLVILPLVNTSQYFPLTIGGAGVREAAFVVAYGMIGVAKPDALAASVTLAAVQYATNALGGVLHAIRPLALEAEDTLPGAPALDRPSGAGGGS